MRAFRSIAAYAAVMIALLVGVIALPTGAADHLDAPLVMTDGRQDINDVYAFQSPATATNTVPGLCIRALIQSAQRAFRSVNIIRYVSGDEVRS